MFLLLMKLNSSCNDYPSGKGTEPCRAASLGARCISSGSTVYLWEHGVSAENAVKLLRVTPGFCVHSHVHLGLHQAGNRAL